MSDWPTIEAHLSADATAGIRIAGNAVLVRATTVDAARACILARVCAIATRLSRAVTVTVTGIDGGMHLRVTPEGIVTLADVAPAAEEALLPVSASCVACHHTVTIAAQQCDRCGRLKPLEVDVTLVTQGGGA